LGIDEIDEIDEIDGFERFLTQFYVVK